ncbi:MAG: patatin-like phospholipase family protein [Gallionella sp.]|nr:patatin-like phospholipase family protein [Gallionella sp.]MDD4945997.1 patatin-like phospholipase family protein [Gallionella sp.]
MTVIKSCGARLMASLAIILLAACNTPPKQVAVPASEPVVARPAPKIALALGGGGARGFAHVGVIKALEAQGIVPDMVVGTSVGSAIGALYAAGYTGFQLQAMSIPMKEERVIDWSWPNRGLFTGKPLQEFINRAVKNAPLEKLRRPFAAVATDLATGEEIVFRSGNTGIAVSASCAVPGIFQPVVISGRSYVDGGLVKPVPVSEARAMGADFVIAVNISNPPQNNKTESTVEVLLQTFDIMSQTINRYELANADVVVRPVIREIAQDSLDDRHLAILEGEKAVAAIMPELKAKLEALRKPR